tara:strand:+ start:1414 stop:1842 length:429 start_codon:yes stop_codon:yes gene_type:complete
MNNYNINIMDIQKKQYEKDKKRLEIYNKILQKCYYKINSTSDNEYEHCFFRVPEYVMGSPIYNLTKCVIFLLQKLRENGFKCKYCHPFMLYISWAHKNNVLLIENTNNLSTKKNNETNDNKHSIYKNIEETPNLDYLLFRKD